jgi:hypothetical protein
MNTKHKFQGVAIAALVLVAATAFAIPNSGPSERGNKAWSDRLSGQAVQEQAQAQVRRANAAYAARLAGQVQSFEKLIKQAEAARLERANMAWSDRLTGMAEAAAK